MTTQKDLSPEQLALYVTQKKSSGMAFCMWFFIGAFGGHYFYLGGKTNLSRAKLRLILTVTLIGAPATMVLVIIDIFKLGQHVEERNVEILSEIKGL